MQHSEYKDENEESLDWIEILYTTKILNSTKDSLNSTEDSLNSTDDKSSTMSDDSLLSTNLLDLELDQDLTFIDEVPTIAYSTGLTQDMSGLGLVHRTGLTQDMFGLGLRHKTGLTQELEYMNIKQSTEQVPDVCGASPENNSQIDTQIIE